VGGGIEMTRLNYLSLPAPGGHRGSRPQAFLDRRTPLAPQNRVRHLQKSAIPRSESMVSHSLSRASTIITCPTAPRLKSKRFWTMRSRWGQMSFAPYFYRSSDHPMTVRPAWFVPSWLRLRLFWIYPGDQLFPDGLGDASATPANRRAGDRDDATRISEPRLRAHSRHGDAGGASR
jgi:hypothetical protein